MSTHNQSLEAICPFYKWEDKTRIVCEGIASGCTIHLMFADGKTKRDFARHQCKSWEYEHCALARMHEGRY